MVVKKMLMVGATPIRTQLFVGHHLLHMFEGANLGGGKALNQCSTKILRILYPIIH